ncbi:MAG: hypothetical protein AAF787_08700 [Chloroflexota bacterium]
MSITVEWYDASQTIVLYSFHDAWTVEDLYTVLERGAELTEEVRDRQKFAVIFDVRDGHHIPPDLLSAVDYLRRHACDCVSVRVFVGDQKYPRMFLNIIKQMVPQVRKNVYYVATLPEALTIIQQNITSKAPVKSGHPTA